MVSPGWGGWSTLWWVCKLVGWGGGCGIEDAVGCKVDKTGGGGVVGVLAVVRGGGRVGCLCVVLGVWEVVDLGIGGGGIRGGSVSGDDIRKNFMDHLFNDFKQKGIHAFKDDRELPKGEEISPHLYKAIEESRFLIVIFSKNYAFSSWCLRELVKILECKQTQNPKHEVRIVFYDVKPDVVRKEKRSYEEAFGKHEVSNRAEVGKWKEALYWAEPNHWANPNLLYKK
ncbi:NB-ARC domains-containing protein [Tanacetum coccineum]|uniref:ADP-ribosyl cyclase/cyclic ADP-ribose hydrolase n=1 Tax=Tanacetum coccineum TaxID=301880 RepID=A0ABQ4ZKI6_9ASTR